MSQDPCWMTRLHPYDRRMRRQHPEEDLLVVFDIDGTLVDKRPMIHHLLSRQDRGYGTDFFRGLRAFQSQGYRVVARVDNEPENPLALQEAGLTGEDVLLHADTEYVFPPKPPPGGLGLRTALRPRSPAFGGRTGARLSSGAFTRKNRSPRRPRSPSARSPPRRRAGTG